MGWLPAPTPQSTALVTGASSGIGAAIAEELAQRGHGVTLVARRPDRLEELARRLHERYGVRAEALPADLADPAVRAELPKRLANLGSSVEILVNNAGFSTTASYADPRLDVDRELDQVRLLCEAVVHLCGVFVPAMAERGRGAVLVTGSTAGFQPLPGNAGYSAAKAHALTFAAALHGELRGKGVAVTALAPGPVETEFTATDPDFPGFRIFPRPLWRTPQHVARLAVEGLDRNRLTVVPGAFFKLGQVAAAVSPPSVTSRVFSSVWMRRR